MRRKWGSKLGFILATSGAAIGLGNIQRFPYVAAEGGGALFVLLYLICVAFIGIPLILVEFALGRYTEKNPVGAIEKIRPKSRWKIVGYLNILTAFFILTYYQVIGGWTLGYIMKMIFKDESGLKVFASNPMYVLGYMALFLAISMMIVMKGVRKGIEKYSKIFMPILFILLLVLIVRSLSLPKCLEGIKYYLKPDFSELKPRIFILALGQAFFSLSIGEAVLTTYGSYVKKEENLVTSALSIVSFDTVIAILAGLIIFPALFSFNKMPNQGVGLTFIILPQIFLKMPFGYFFGFLFFLLLSFAAITTAIALLEMPVSFLIDKKRWSRKKAVWIVGIIVFLLGIPSALSKGANLFLSNMKLGKEIGFYNIMDFLWGNIGMIAGGGFLAIFVGWIWKEADKELLMGSEKFYLYQPFWKAQIKYLCPILIFIILVSLFL